MAKDLDERTDLSVNGKELKLLYQSFNQGYKAAEGMKGSAKGEDEANSIERTLKNMENLGARMEKRLKEYDIDPEEVGTGMEVPDFVKRMLGGIL
mgnify:CR=1 FL=1